MSKVIPQRKLRNETAQVIDAVASGETFVVTRSGVPVAEIGPNRGPRRSSIPKNDLLALASRGPNVDLRQFHSDLKRIVDQSF